MNKPELVLSSMTADRFDEGVRFLAHGFAKGEPLVVHLGITEHDMFEFIKLMLSTIRLQRSSIATIDNKIVGLLLCESFDDPGIELAKDKEQRFLPIMEMLTLITDDFFNTHPIDRSLVFHQAMITVDPHYKGMKIAENLVYFSNDLARKSGFKYSLAEVTGPISQNILLDRCGYQLGKKYYYRDMKDGSLSTLTDMKLAEFCASGWLKL